MKSLALMSLILSAYACCQLADWKDGNIMAWFCVIASVGVLVLGISMVLEEIENS